MRLLEARQVRREAERTDVREDVDGSDADREGPDGGEPKAAHEQGREQEAIGQLHRSPGQQQGWTRAREAREPGEGGSHAGGMVW